MLDKTSIRKAAQFTLNYCDNPPKTTKALVEHFDGYWNKKTETFKNIPYVKETFVEQIKEYNERFSLHHDPKTQFGYTRKKDLEPGTQIFVRADLHGDLKSLLENIKTLQREGLLDDNYKCKENVQLVFLGDYVDRGENCIEVLKLLMALHFENPSQVTLIRGNHEEVEMNCSMGASDSNFSKLLIDEPDLLQNFYERLPLTVYMAEKGNKREYVQFTHGTFEPKIDPYSLLKAENNNYLLKVRKFNTYSKRVRDMFFKGSELQKSAVNSIKNLVAQGMLQNYSVYSWGDMGVESNFGDSGSRQWKISPNDTKNYFRMCGGEHKVKFLFRGHQHRKQHHQYEGKNGLKTIVSTMPIGMDCPKAKEWYDQQDTGYILTIAPKVKNWTKKAYLRNPGSSDVTITNAYPIRSTEI